MISATKEIKKSQTSIASTTTIAIAGSHARVTAFPKMPLLVLSRASRPLHGQLWRRVAHDPLIIARSVVLDAAAATAVIFVKVVSVRIFLIVCISLSICHQ